MLQRLTPPSILLILCLVVSVFASGVATANSAPTLDTSMSDVKVVNSLVGQVYGHLHFSDPDGDTLTYTASSSDTNIAEVTVGGVGNSTVYIIANGLGRVTITVTATDPGGLTASTTFTASVIPQNNSAPTAVGTIPDQTVVISRAAITIETISDYFSDTDGEVDTLTYTVASSDTGIATVSLSDDTLSLTAVAAGTVTITVTATDLSDATGTQTFSTLSTANRAPTGGSLPDTGVPAGNSFSVNLDDYFSDPDGDTLTYTASINNSSIGSVSVSGSTLTVATKSNVGAATISVTAADPDSLTASGSFQIVTQVNNVGGQIPGENVDALPGLTSDELAQLSALLADNTLIINELYNGSEDATDWLEFRNVSAANLPLDDWELSVLMGERNAVVTFPAGTVIRGGGVLLLVNTENATADMREGFLNPILSVVVETFALPQEEFALILQGPSGIGDLAVNYFQTESASASETAPFLTVDTVWQRNRPVVSGYLAAAWSSSAEGTPGSRHPTEVADLNADGSVDILDLVLVASQFGMNATPAADLNADGTVNIQDLVLVANTLNDITAAPTAQQSQASVVNNWLQLARQNAVTAVQTPIPEGFSYERGILTLEQLARSFVPEATALLANYPNPFNPETWIPYQLSKASDVTVTIYASDGSIVRTLALGHQDAGMYHNRTHAAYWDGRNAFGETVASGVYFYTLTAGDFAATRKMLVLK